MNQNTAASTVARTASPDLSQLSPAQKRELLSQLLAQKSAQTFPLSAAQRRLWFLDQLQPNSAAYILPAVFRLTGNLDVSRLEHCLDQILQRHETLRTQFVTIADSPRQQVISAKFAWSLAPITLIAESDAPTLIQSFIHQGFDLSQAPLFRVQLLPLDRSSDALLLIVVHHIIADYQSLRLLFKEIIQCYQGQDLPPLSIQYADYAVWQEQSIDRHDAQRRYWQTQLAQAPTGLPLLTDFPRSTTPNSPGTVQKFSLSAPLSEQLRQLSRQENATLFMTLLAAFKVLLHRYSGQSDLLVGSTIDQRYQPELQPLIGLFVNNLVFRSTVNSDDSFQTYLQQIRQISVDAYAHRDLPFEELIEHLAIERHLNQNPLFQIAFVLHSATETIHSIELPQLQLSYVPQQQQTSRFDLSLDLDDRPSGLTGQLEYRTDLFAESTIARLIQHFEQVLAAIVTAPTIVIARIPLQTPAELEQLDRWNHTAESIPYNHLLERFDHVVQTRPANLAITDSSATLSYAELNTQANALANYLVQQGIQPGDRVGICLARSKRLLVALIAVLKTGAAYVPLDPSYPVDRLAFIQTEAQLSYLLTDASQDWEAIDNAENDTWINRSIIAQDTAYIIYTSGSTGQPKGVQVLHQGLINLLWDLQRRFALTENDRWLAVTTIAFDIAALELFLPLMVGAQVVIADQAQDAQALVEQLETQAITCMQATPATWRMLLETPWSGHPNLQIFSGGEALNRVLAQQLQSRCRQLWNLYGPTETTIWSGVYPIDNFTELNQANVPIGAPIANTQFYVLDQHREPVGIGIPGELHIGGAGVAQGYWQQPDRTATQFISTATNRLYATGDRVRRLSDGNLEYLGRLDFQVKLRGYRIELGEIEACIMAYPPVAQAIVALAGDGDHQRLVAYYRVNEDASTSIESAIVEFLRSRLPAYMVPSQLVHLDTFPLTPNGKVDRQALPTPPAQTVALTPPQTTTEIQLAAIWCDLLAIAQVSIQDDFFALGGHSLLATRLIAKVQQVFQVDLPLQQFFMAPQLEPVARSIDQSRAKSIVKPFDIPLRESGTVAPLSFAQQRFWLLNQLEPESTAYHIPIVLRLTGTLDVNRLRSSFEQVVDRHAVLRTKFVAIDAAIDRDSDKPVAQLIVEATAKFDFQGSASPTLIEQPFNLSQDVPLRVYLQSDSPQQHVLTIVLHHIAADAWSINLLLGELAQAYRHLPLPQLPIQYSDFSAWQRDWLKGDRTTEQLAYWQQQLANAPTSLDLPTDRPRTASSLAPAQIQEFTFSTATTDRLQQYCQQQGITLYMLLVASYGLLLLRYTDSAEVLIGSPIANRTRTELEPLIGCFTNTLVLRVDGRDHPTVTAFLARIKAMMVAAYAHQDLPFEQLLEALHPDRSLVQNPIFQTMLVLQNAPVSTFLSNPSAITDLIWEAIVPPPAQAKFDLLLTYTESNSGLCGKVEYDADLFDAETINRLVQHLKRLVIEIIEQPDQSISQLTILSPAEIQQFQQWNQTQRDYALQPIHQMIEAQVDRAADHVAIVDGTTELTYAALNAQANQLAHWIQAQNITQRIPSAVSSPVTETTIGICFERNAAMLVAMLAVLKTGAAYVPIDPTYPPDRIQYLLEDANLCGLITQASLAKVFDGVTVPTIVWDAATIATYPQTNLPSSTQLTDLAYLIYTSGSTGRPKGVEITHHSAATFLKWGSETFDPSVLQGVLASTSICFDLSTFELFLPLTIGGCVILADNALALPTLPAADRVTLINTVPAIMQALLQQTIVVPGAFALPKSLRVINLAGEALSAGLVEQLYQLPQIERVYNLYGPSEDTTYSTYKLLPRSDTNTPSAIDRPTIGYPIANTRAYILDAQQNTTPIGVPGELYLAGDGLARGYWQRPELTADRFIQLGAERLYRTGDRAKFLSNGEIAYLGRLDDQIKLRGFRIELGEITACIESHPAIVKAIVVLNDQQLIGYYQAVGCAVPQVVPQGNASPHPDSTHQITPIELRQFLIAQLPNAFIPGHLIALTEFPLTPNGKLDRAALPPPETIQHDPANVAAPVTDEEIQLLAIWQKLLNQSLIGIYDNFFELGGDSILVLQMVSYARQRDLSITPRQVFQHPTIAQLASLPSINVSAPLIDQAPIVGDITLAPIQQWFFQQNLAAAHHWNQTLLLTIPKPMTPQQLDQIVRALMHHHDVLRSRFVQTDTGWQQEIIAPDDVELATLPIQYLDLSDTIDPPAELTKISTQLQASLVLAESPLLRIGYFHWLDGTTNQRHDRLLLVFHHLIIDGLSWRILLEDWQMADQQIQLGQSISLPLKTVAYRDWTQQLQAYQPDSIALQYWHPDAWQLIVPLPIDVPQASNTIADLEVTSIQLSALDTQNLLQVVPRVYQTQINDLLLTALAMTLQTWTGQSCCAIELEGHGRDSLVISESTSLDLSRTIGWFTSLFPIRLDLEHHQAPGELIKTVKEQLRQIPTQGIDYGISRYLNPRSTIALNPASIRFNYLGQTDATLNASGFQPAIEASGSSRAPTNQRDIAIEVNALVINNQLRLDWSYSQQQYQPQTIVTLAQQYCTHLETLIQHCLNPDSGGYTPSDFPDMDFSQTELDDFLDTI